jgi:hypothetical protein
VQAEDEMKHRAVLRKQECSMVTDILSRKKLLSKAAKLEELKAPVSPVEQVRTRAQPIAFADGPMGSRHWPLMELRIPQRSRSLAVWRSSVTGGTCIPTAARADEAA